MAKLSDKQQLFIKEYLIDLNAYQAALRSGYAEKTAKTKAHKWLEKASFQSEIQKAMSKREKRTEITQDEVLKELAKIAFANATELVQVVEKTGKNPLTDEVYHYQSVEITETNKLSADQKAVISSIKETKNGIAVESYDKVKALELLGRHLGMFKDKVEVSGNTGLPVEEKRKLAKQFINGLINDE